MNFKDYAYDKYQWCNTVEAALEMFPSRDVIAIIDEKTPMYFIIDNIMEKYPSAKRTQSNRVKIGNRSVTILCGFKSHIMGYNRNKTVMVVYP